MVKGLGLFHSRSRVESGRSLLQIPILLSRQPGEVQVAQLLIQIGALFRPLKCIFELECLDPSSNDEEVEIQVLPSQLEDVLWRRID